MVFSSGALKQAWIDQNKTEEKTQEIAVKPVEENENPVPNDEYKGRGTLEFELIATPEIENWLKAKQYKLEIAAGKYIPKIKVGLPGSLEVPGGKYNLTMSIPECKALPAIEIDLKKDAVQKVKVFVQPVDAVLKIECNVPKFQVWWSNAWLDTNVRYHLSDGRRLQRGVGRSEEYGCQPYGYDMRWSEAILFAEGDKRCGNCGALGNTRNE